MYKHYTVTDGIFNKVIYYSEKITMESVELEAELQQVANMYGFSPKVTDVVYADDSATIHMEFIDEPCLYYKYGPEPEDIPEFVWEQIREKLKVLYDDERIEYIDVTPYNFIEKDGDVYIIDFGHANYVEGEEELDDYFIDFMEGENDWNYDYYDVRY